MAERRNFRVGLLVTCLVDLMRPSVGFAAVKLLEDAGCTVDVPGQTCCGQPMVNTGYLDEAPVIAPPPTATPTRLGMKDIIDQFSAATTDETVLDVAARFLAQDIPRVWVFLLKQGELTSWGGRGLDAGRLKSVRVPLAELPVVARTTRGTPHSRSSTRRPPSPC